MVPGKYRKVSGILHCAVDGNRGIGGKLMRAIEARFAEGRGIRTAGMRSARSFGAMRLSRSIAARGRTGN